MRSRAAIEGLEAWGSFAHYDSIACDLCSWSAWTHGHMDAWTHGRRDGTVPALGVVDDGMGSASSRRHHLCSCCTGSLIRDRLRKVGRRALKATDRNSRTRGRKWNVGNPGQPATVTSDPNAPGVSTTNPPARQLRSHVSYKKGPRMAHAKSNFPPLPLPYPGFHADAAGSPSPSSTARSRLPP